MDIRYFQDKAASAEILRLLLPKMSAHPAPFVPTTYTVWFEHLTGINPPLSKAINELLDAKGQLDSQTIQSLFERYISESNPEAQKNFRQNMQKALDNLQQVAELSDTETGRFSAGLQKHGETLAEEMDARMLQNLVSEISQDTQTMRQSVEALQSKLHESKEEVEKLNLELQNARVEALIDPLTDIYNRRGFEAQMKKYAADSELQGKKVCFLMLDIDHFKKINDSYGHLFGDKVIRSIAAALKANVKGQDSVARVGGEEFAVILPDTPLEGAYTVAEHIRKIIEKGKIRVQNKDEFIGGITISIGIAEGEIAGNWTEVLSKADEALYVSKTTGRNKTSLSANAVK